MKELKKHIIKIEKVLIKIFYYYIAYVQFLIYVCLSIFATFKDESVFIMLVILIIPTVIIGLIYTAITVKYKYDSIIDSGKLVWLYKNSKKPIKLIMIVYLIVILISIIFTHNIEYIMITLLLGIGNYTLTCELFILSNMFKL